MKKIIVCSPSYDGAVRVEYMKSILRLIEYFRDSNIKFDLIVEKSTILHEMRSVMASKVLHDRHATHLLFIDTDMGFDVSAVRKMIDSGRDVIGCACPYRTIPLHENVNRPGESLRKTISKKLPYNVGFAPGTTEISIANGICEVDRIGTGLLLISKHALKSMHATTRIEHFKNKFPYNQWYDQEEYVGFFEHMKSDGYLFGEDYSFCMRWKTLC